MSAASAVFSQIYRENLWGAESRSGHGSTTERTVFVRAGLEQLIQRFGPFTMLDLPCGVGDWIRPVLETFDLDYTGADIVEDVIATNQERWPNNRWQVLDICESRLPESDLVFCRDCLVHLPLDLVFRALRNIQNSGSKYLAVTTFPQIPEGNRDIPIGSWRRLDLTSPPFNLPEPIAIYNECQLGPPRPQDKSLGVWSLRDLRLP